MNFVLIALVLIGIKWNAGAVIQDFYWRDYVPGDIPADALEGVDGRYIGQVVHNAFNMVANIYPHQNIAVIEYWKKIIYKENIKILCTQECGRFYWEHVNFTEPPRYQMENAVKGGYQEDKRSLYIGKIFHQNEWRIGKVEAIEVPGKGIWIWNDDETPYRGFEFDLLKYNDTMGNQCVAKNKFEI